MNSVGNGSPSPISTARRFMCTAYSFGQLLVLSLYKQYRLEGESFKPRYIKLLSAGGSLAPMQILEEAGIDPRPALLLAGAVWM